MVKSMITGIGSLYEIIVNVQNMAEQEIGEMAAEIQEKLMDSPPVGTPVATGWARSNWQIETGGPPDGVVGSKAAVSDQKALSDRAKIRLYKLSQGDIFIQNNVPYIGVLNQGGHSQQSPPFFVDAAVLEVTEKRRSR